MYLHLLIKIHDFENLCLYFIYIFDMKSQYFDHLIIFQSDDLSVPQLGMLQRLDIFIFCQQQTQQTFGFNRSILSPFISFQKLSVSSKLLTFMLWSVNGGILDTMSVSLPLNLTLLLFPPLCDITLSSDHNCVQSDACLNIFPVFRILGKSLPR